MGKIKYTCVSSSYQKICTSCRLYSTFTSMSVHSYVWAHTRAHIHTQTPGNLSHFWILNESYNYLQIFPLLVGKTTRKPNPDRNSLAYILNRAICKPKILMNYILQYFFSSLPNTHTIRGDSQIKFCPYVTLLMYFFKCW